MIKQMLASVLALALMSPVALPAQSQPVQSSPSSASAPSSEDAQNQAAAPRPRSRASRRSYARETQTRRRHHISKGEVAFMAAIAGTSMGIGALAAGGHGLAIGAIVGGWGAYAGHRLWHWVNR